MLYEWKDIQSWDFELSPDESIDRTNAVGGLSPSPLPYLTSSEEHIQAIDTETRCFHTLGPMDMSQETGGAERLLGIEAKNRTCCWVSPKVPSEQASKAIDDSNQVIRLAYF